MTFFLNNLHQIFRTTRYTTCIPEDVGGSGNPSIKTGHGIVSAMEGALSFHGDTLKDKRISIEGFGNVSQAMVRHLFQNHDRFKVGSIYATDINRDALDSMKKIKSEYPSVDIDLKVNVVPFGDSSGIRSNFSFVEIVYCSTYKILHTDTVLTENRFL